MIAKKSYEIVEKDGQKGIKCRVCDLTSWHPKDVKYLYCGNCHKFHMTFEFSRGIPEVAQAYWEEAYRKLSD